MNTRKLAVFLMWLLSLVLMACGGAPSQPSEPTPQAPAETQGAPVETQAPAKGKIVISNWDAYMPGDLLEKFTAETGIQVELALHATNEEIVGKLVASKGKGFDVVFMTGQFADAMAKMGLLSEIDYTKLPNSANLFEEVKRIPFTKYAVPYTWGTTGLCYRSDLVNYEPDSWYDLLKPKPELVGKITMLSTDRWLLLPAQKALGFSANTTDEQEMQQVKELLIEAKKTLLAYDNTTFYSKLVSGEALLVEAWDGWCNYGIAENPDIRFVIPKEGSDLWVDAMVIPAPSENKEAAYAFIDYVLRPEIGTWVAENILYKVPSRAVMEKLSPDLLNSFPNLAIPPGELLKQEALQDVGEAQSLYSAIVAEVLASE
ncbi:MAG: spermidine/putrescine ABC transporter substrate-binding protein [Anaerolineales bacterium]|nr:spermidine/putrescine ABC transporter substrate-binding protein [Anaerolineales bacterium]MCS7248622.1 spermidine/putrescine ABC transporter substrate-binding protein [Anaerolineales bacterium]MDW8162435.1 spermidine/putrescine ABC transporter substrate-binding protein [Anaerolineales bacterium]MDW8447196.1 spermidine/putrescine ABC transporter substrate-binding protein [Anaerolineales bacterium]